MEMMTTKMMKQMKEPVNNLVYWAADPFSHQSSLRVEDYNLQSITFIVYKPQTMSLRQVIFQKIYIGSKAMKEAAMIEAEMEEINDQEDCQA